jgi:hypothetical protein
VLPMGPSMVSVQVSLWRIIPLVLILKKKKNDVNMLLKAQWKCTMLKPMIKIYLYIYLEFSKNSRFFCLRVYTSISVKYCICKYFFKYCICKYFFKTLHMHVIAFTSICILLCNKRKLLVAGSQIWLVIYVVIHPTIMSANHPHTMKRRYFGPCAMTERDSQTSPCFKERLHYYYTLLFQTFDSCGKGHIL